MVGLWEWLLVPVDPTRPHEIDVLVAWHARLMTAGWAVLAPVGVLAARYFKIPPGSDWPRRLDDRRWWIAHRLCQYGAASCSVVALTLIAIRLGEVSFARLHTLLGWAVLGLLVVQITGAWLRGRKGGPTAPAPDGSLRGDHFDMTSRRVWFERVHKSMGYAALALAAGAIVSGLWTANAPRWMWLVIMGFEAALIALFALLQRRGLAIDTYQAIWGPDPSLPGARLKPIGWGVRRLQDGERP